MSIQTALTKQLTSLKKAAEKVKPKPIEAFFKVFKGPIYLNTDAAAKTLDGVAEGTNNSDPKTAVKDFKEVAGRLFKSFNSLLGPTETAGKLEPLVTDAQTAVNLALTQLVKKLSGETESEPSTETIDPKVLQALKEHVALRLRGEEAVKKWVVTCQSFLAAAKMNHKRGKEGLEVNQKVAKGILEGETKIAQHGDFFAGRKALNPKISKALDKGPYPKELVTQLRKKSAVSFENGMRAMAEARDLRIQVLAEVQEHEFEVEKQEATFLKDDNTRLEQLKKLKPVVLQVTSNKLLMKTDIESWGKIQALTVEGIRRMQENGKSEEEFGYRTKRDETKEAFDGLPKLTSLFQLVFKRLNLVLTGNPSKEVQEEAFVLRQQLSPLGATIKQAEKNQTDFESLVDKCDEMWEEALSEL